MDVRPIAARATFETRIRELDRLRSRVAREHIVFQVSITEGSIGECTMQIWLDERIQIR